MTRLALAVAFLAYIAPPVRAAAPVVEFLYPAGGQRGTTVAVKAGGKLDKWPVQAWTDAPGLKVQPGAESGSLTIQIDKDVAAGPHLLRLYNAEGPSVPRVFVVGEGPETAETEPNDEASRAQAVKELPATINGRLDKNGDVDSYAVKLEAGQWLTAVVQGRRLGSPMDPLLHAYDAEGHQVGFAHDGLGLDPLLVFRASKAGTYYVRVSAFAFPPAADVKLAGGAQDVYRLNLRAGAPALHVMPAGVRRGTKARVQLVPWRQGAGEARSKEVDATAVADGDDSVLVPGCGAEGGLRVYVGDGPEWTEAEAGSAAAAQPPAAPFAVTGRVEHDGEEDGFRFTARKGEQVVFSVHSVALVSAMDPALRVEDESGKALASDDDGGGRDPMSPLGGDARLEWDPGADGVYRVVVSDLYGRGGEGYVYRLAVQKKNPAMVATVTGDEFRVAAGKSESIKVRVIRRTGDDRGLVVTATGLPAGVTATAAEVPAASGDMTVTLTAAADAKAAAGPFQVMVLSTDPQYPSANPASAALRKDKGQELVAQTQALWLTVLAAAPEPAKK